MQVTQYNQVTTEVTVTGAGVSEALTNIPVPCTVVCHPSSGTASIEYTLDPTLVSWQTWHKGVVAAYAEDVLLADIVALRLNVVSGTAIVRLATGGQNG